MSPKSCFAVTAGMSALFASLSAFAQVPEQGDKRPVNNRAASASALHISVYGAVARPGVYPYKSGERVINALNDVSGPTPQADLSNIKIAHTGKAYDMMQPVWVNFNDFVLHGKQSGNPLLQPGDDLYVLGKRSRSIPQPPEF